MLSGENTTLPPSPSEGSTSRPSATVEAGADENVSGVTPEPTGPEAGPEGAVGEGPIGGVEGVEGAEGAVAEARSTELRASPTRPRAWT